MKNLFYLFFISALLFASCDEAVSIEEEVIVPPEEVIPTPIPDEKNTPSDFDFSTLQANDTLYIAYSHDLGGKSIQVPADVVINYNKGEIVNGTLVFTQGKIASELFNKDLKIEGKPTLQDNTYKFITENWDITEGEVNDAFALKNKQVLENAIAEAKLCGAETFEMDNIDAYFLVTSEKNLGMSRDEAISLPSNFFLKMSNSTHLRVQPNRYFRYALFELRAVKNVNISGGNLYGDRDSHTYDPITTAGITYTTHEWGHVIQIVQGVNVNIQNVKVADGTGDGIEVASLHFTYHPDYIGSNNITISNCTFDSNRRNNLSITDGYNMLIENNTILNAGVDTPYSNGTAPRYGIDIEALRRRDSNGEFLYDQRAKDITIRNNVERGSANGAIIVAIGEDVLVENNTTEHSIGFSVASGVKIKGNTIVFADREQTAIFAGVLDENASIYNNEISGNTVKGHSLGLMIHNADVKVFDNIIEDCNSGIVLRNLRDAEVYDNKITSSRENSYGIPSYLAGMNNVLIHDNDIDVKFFPISFIDVNNENGHENNTVTVKNNNLSGGEVKISNSKGIIVE